MSATRPKVLNWAPWHPRHYDQIAGECQGLKLFCGGPPADECPDIRPGRLCEPGDFLVAAVLNGMGHKDRRSLIAQGFPLGVSRLDEFRRSDKSCRCSQPFEFQNVMQTTRCAGSSIGQPDHEQITFLMHLLA